MSITAGQRVPCTCGAPVEVFLAESINAARHPHLRQMILERRLHRFVCGSCQRTLVFETALSYVDWDRRQLLQVAPRTELGRADEQVALTRGLFDRVFAVGPEPVHALRDQFFVRLCFGYEELREKLVCFDAGLNDLVLELMKVELMLAEPALQRGDVITLRLEAVRDDGALLLRAERAGVAAVDAPPDPAVIEVRPDYYQHLAGRYPEVLARRPRLADGPHVSLLRLYDWPAGGPAQAPVVPRSLL